MIGFQFGADIARAPHDVFAVVADPRTAVDFIDGIVESIKVTEGPVGVGTVFRETRSVKGKEATAELVIDAYEPDTHLAITSQAEGISVTYHYKIAPTGTGSRIDWTCELEAGGLRRMMLPLVAAIMKKEDGDHLERLKSYLEAERTPEATS